MASQAKWTVSRHYSKDMRSSIHVSAARVRKVALLSGGGSINTTFLYDRPMRGVW
jgi:hypothetical protein